MFEEISAFFELYGWYILIASIIFAYVFMKYLKPAIENFQRERYLTQIKKFDKNVSEKYGDKMKEAREKQYQKYLAEAAREQERAAEKRRLREEKDKEESFSENSGNSLNASKSFDPVVNAEEYVINKITSKKVVIFSKRSCPFCVKAKQALSSFRLSNDDYEVVELDDFEGKVGHKLQNVLEQITGVHSVPRVFINEQCIGGGDDTVAALRDGRLERWLRDANAI